MPSPRAAAERPLRDLPLPPVPTHTRPASPPQQALARPDGLAPRPPPPGRPLAVQVADDGQVTLQRDLKLQRLVLTGGGAKGAVYPGAIQALEDSGQLAHIREVGGTSIGAVVAALLAAGMDARGCKSLLDQVNLPLLFARDEKPVAELSQPAPRLGRLRSSASLLRNLGSRAPNLKSLIDHATRHAALDRLGDQAGPVSAAVQRISDKLAVGGTLNLGDLHTLSEQVPGIKDLFCTSTAVYSGPGVQGKVRQLAVFSSQDADCHDMALSEAVCASAALPLVFSARRHPMAHDLADSPATRTRLVDGGVTLNTPIRELIDPDTPPVQNLILSFEDPRITRARQADAQAGSGSLRGGLAARAIKSVPMARHYVSRREFLAHELVHGPLADQTLEVQLKGVAGQADYSGSKGRLAIWMTQAEKDELQQHLCNKVLDHLAQRRPQQTFASLHHLLFALDGAEMKEVRDALPSPAMEAAAQRVDRLRESLASFVATMGDWDDSLVRAGKLQQVTGWMAAVDRDLGEDRQCRDAFAQALAADAAPQVQRLLDLLRDGPPPADAASLQAVCLHHDELRATRRIALRIRSEFIYPSLHRPLQEGRNEQALRRADQELSQAGSRAEINAALQRLEASYEVLGFKALQGLSPVVPKLKTYYLPSRGRRLPTSGHGDGSGPVPQPASVPNTPAP